MQTEPMSTHGIRRITFVPARTNWTPVGGARGAGGTTQGEQEQKRPRRISMAVKPGSWPRSAVNKVGVFEKVRRRGGAHQAVTRRANTQSASNNRKAHNMDSNANSARPVGAKREHTACATHMTRGRVRSMTKGRASETTQGHASKEGNKDNQVTYARSKGVEAVQINASPG